jgi:hypothetical protein
MRKKGLGLSLEEVVKIQTLLDVADACLEDCEDTLTDTLMNARNDSGVLARATTARKELEELVAALADIRRAIEEVGAIVEVDE